MSFLSTLFGGTSLEKIPGAQPYIDKLGNFDPLMYGAKLGLGRVGKAAREDFKALRSGQDISKIAGFSGQLGAINSAYDSGDRARSREFQSNVALMNQPGLAAAQSAELQRKSDQDRSGAISQAAGGFYDRVSDTLNSAFLNSQDRKLRAAGMKNSSDQAALSAYLQQFYQKQNPGILNTVANLGSAAAGVGGLFKGGG